NPTGRSAFAAALADCCMDARATRRMLAVVKIELASLKPIKAAFGHETGNTIATRASQRLLENTPGALALAQVGDDEFALAFPVEDAESALARARLILELLESPLHLDDGTAVRLSCAGGVALFPGHGSQPGKLMDCADIALRRA